MIFNSPTFLIFLLLCVAVFYILPKKRQNLFLLLASFVCYMWAVPQYGVLLLGTIWFCYFGALNIEKASEQKKRKTWLVLSIAVPLLLLGVFKYFNFFMSGYLSILKVFGIFYESIELGWVLPVGISFYTFQLVGYCVDVYHKKAVHEKDFIDFALFISFFPQVLAGPIGRADELLPQYKVEHKFCYETLCFGLRRFLLGIFKKVVVADGFGLLVNSIYADLRDYSGVTLFLVVLMYGMQIYLDFSGYSDMAIGVAQIFGIHLRENFLAPYFATSINDFWKRWHISLTSWFRDYVYIPLGGNRKGFFRKSLNIAVVFLISGLWHGAALTFVAWGLVHAFARICEELINKYAPKKTVRNNLAVRSIKQVLVFLFGSFAFVLFRANNFSDAAYIFSSIFKGGNTVAQLGAMWQNASPGITIGVTYTLLYFVILAVSFIIVFMFDALLAKTITQKVSPLLNPLNKIKKAAPRWILYWYMSLSTMFFYFITTTATKGSASFIYFGF